MKKETATAMVRAMNKLYEDDYGDEYWMINATAMSVAFPDTFEVPDDEDLDAIKPDDSIKVCFQPVDGGPGDRIWLLVKDYDATTGFGTAVAEDGWIVDFHKDFIYQIW